jgi:hypothetical protein
VRSPDWHPSDLPDNAWHALIGTRLDEDALDSVCRPAALTLPCESCGALRASIALRGPVLVTVCPYCDTGPDWT